jgi:hypothetical protein
MYINKILIKYYKKNIGKLTKESRKCSDALLHFLVNLLEK